MRRVIVPGTRLALAVALAASIITGGQAAAVEPIPCEHIGVIGDSLTVGGVTQLPQELIEAGFGDIRIDAKIGRRINARSPWGASGVTALQAMRAVGYEPDCVVVALGTNDLGIWKGATKFRAAIEAMLTEIGEGPRVLWVNVVWRKFPATGAVFNGVLAELAGSRANLSVADWAGEVAQHPRWLSRDGVHQSIAGRREWARFVARIATTTIGAEMTLGPPPSACSVAAVPVKVGTKGPDALCLETRLHQLRYQPGTPDSSVSWNTYRALMSWQSLHGLPAKGRLDAVTRTALGLDPTT